MTFKHLSIISFIILSTIVLHAQQVGQRGDTKVYYWTVWFKTIAYPPNFDSTNKGHEWIQSFNDPWAATMYCENLRNFGKVRIYNKYISIVDTSSVYIDSFNMVTRKYSFEH